MLAHKLTHRCRFSVLSLAKPRFTALQQHATHHIANPPKSSKNYGPRTATTLANTSPTTPLVSLHPDALVRIRYLFRGALSPWWSFSLAIPALALLLLTSGEYVVRVVDVVVHVCVW